MIEPARSCLKKIRLSFPQNGIFALFDSTYFWRVFFGVLCFQQKLFFFSAFVLLRIEKGAVAELSVLLQLLQPPIILLCKMLLRPKIPINRAFLRRVIGTRGGSCPLALPRCSVDGSQDSAVQQQKTPRSFRSGAHPRKCRAGPIITCTKEQVGRLSSVSLLPTSSFLSREACNPQIQVGIPYKRCGFNEP